MPCKFARRLSAKKTPQVVSVGTRDIVKFGPIDTMPKEYDFSRKINHQMPSIEIIYYTHQKFDGLIYRKHKQDGRYYFSTSLTCSVT
ncbi:MAG: Tm-1-like ATP-binding domain-containing protein [Selenomonadaceae bacterium]|nr:Tm-1-like ATP-binding domain-containing protein [Selenomonadaceae bacterium]